MARAGSLWLILVGAGALAAAQCPVNGIIASGGANFSQLTTLGPIGPQADGKSQPAPLTQITVIQPTAPMCPVRMNAQQSAGSTLLSVRGDQNPSAPAQHIHLVLSQDRTGQIASAKIRVRGLSGKNRLVQADCGQEVSYDRFQTLDVPFNEEKQSGFGADLVLPGFASVQSIEILSITYGDGSTWKLESHNACQVAPDPMMRIAGR
jgi:hypothetical protein